MTTTMKQYATRLDLHADWKIVRSIVQHLTSAMEELNTSDADGSPLPTDLSSSASAYGFAKKALDAVILAQFGFDLPSVDVNWGGSGRWDQDVKGVLMKELVKEA